MRIFITGGTRGIGLALVRACKAAGHTVATCGRGPRPPECDLYYQGDITEPMRRSALIDIITADLGGLDVLVNNAGAQIHKPIQEYSYLDWQAQIELMLTTPFVLSRNAARWMLAHDGGQIINVISTSAFQGARYVTGYVAAKHGLLGLTRAMAVELAPRVRVIAVAPGLTETEMTNRLTGYPLVDYYLGTFLLALLTVLVGELTISLVFRINKAHLDKLNAHVEKMKRLSSEASALGDQAGYKACTKEGNDAFLGSFFSTSSGFPQRRSGRSFLPWRGCRNDSQR